MRRNFRMLSQTLGSSLIAAMLLAGCAGNSPRPEKEKIDQVITLYDTGNLNAEQAVSMIAVINETDRIPEADRTPIAAAPAPSVAAPAVPSVESAAAGGYKPTAVLTGRLRSIGSDTMDNLMANWEKDFQRFHPGIRFFHEGKGSSTAPAALLEGRSDFGPMSRPLKTSEIEAFKAKFGYEPTSLRVAIDAIAVYVHPSNPIATKGLSVEQLDAIFSSDRKLGHPDVTTWGQLGLTGEWANAPIRVYSRNSASGTYGFFREAVLAGGNFKTTNKELPGSEAVVDSVASDPYGIGYSGIAYKKPTVATLPLAAKSGAESFPPEDQYAYTNQYPLARFMYIVLNHKPGAAPIPLHQEFAAYLFSPEGQAFVAKEGFYRVSSKIAAEDLAKLK